VALVSPLTLVNSPLDFLVFKTSGTGPPGTCARCCSSPTCFWDDMDESRCPCPREDSASAAIVKVGPGASTCSIPTSSSTGGAAPSRMCWRGTRRLGSACSSRYALPLRRGGPLETLHPQAHDLLSVGGAAGIHAAKGRDGDSCIHRLLRQAIEVASSDWNRLPCCRRAMAGSTGG